MILRLNKTTLFKQNAFLFFIRKSTLLWKWKNNYQIQDVFMHVVFFITSNVLLKLKYIYA